MLEKLKKGLRIAGVICAFGWAIYAGSMYTQFNDARTLVAYAQVATTSTMLPIAMEAPVLQRIADCESGNGTPNSGKQFLANGNVVTNLNKNGSIDIGKYQINLNIA